MNLKRKIAASAAVLLLIGSVMNVSAAELSSKDYVSKLIKSNQAELIIDVEAYKAAYSDLAKAFGNDTEAYINHYLTKGVYEGRTKGVLFDPLIYAEAYSDIKNALGYDIEAIVQHYLTFGISENRTQGTAHGYADIASAEKAGVQNTNINRAVSSTGSSVLSSNHNDSGDSSLNNYTAGNISPSNNNTAGNVSPGNNNTAGNVSPGNNNTAGNVSPANNNTAGNVSPGNNNIAGNVSPDNNSIVGNSTPDNNVIVGNSSTSNSTIVAANSGSTVNNDTGSSSSSNNNSVVAADNSSSDVSVSTDSASADTGKGYDHTTSIYDDDTKNLLRVEYYDESGKLLQYSDVTYSDSSTNSYTENIYHYDEETDTEILDRTDTYENGSLVSSVNQ